MKSSKGKREERRPRRLDHQGGSFSFSYPLTHTMVESYTIKYANNTLVLLFYLVSSIIVMIYDLNSTKTMFAINSLQDVTPH